MVRSIDKLPTTTDVEHRAAMAWLASHPGALAAYVSEWVAIGDDRVIAHGQSMIEVEHDAQRQGFDDPLLVPVMTSPFVSG